MFTIYMLSTQQFYLSLLNSPKITIQDTNISFGSGMNEPLGFHLKVFLESSDLSIMSGHSFSADYFHSRITRKLMKVEFDEAPQNLQIS